MKNLLHCILLFNLIFALQNQFPYSFSNVIDDIEQIILPEINIESLLKQDNEAPPNTPYHYGEKISVNINPENSGKWIETSNGARIWRVHIQSNGAFGIKPSFNEFFLPEGTKLFIYNVDSIRMIDRFTSD